MSDLFRELILKTQQKDFSALAKLLTFLDKEGAQCLNAPELLSPPQLSFRLGITGPPGAGKSTLIGGLITQLRKKGLSIGVLAVDPSSPFSKGAILGDRIRYSEHFGDDQVFIRSIGTRGSLGGLSASAYLMLRAYDLLGFDITLIETVGVGQTELEIIHVADSISVVLVPESGDSIQAMKAGLLEVADLYIVNKADRPGADQLVQSLKAYAGGYDSHPDIIQTKALQGDGLELFAEKILKEKQTENFKSNRVNPLKLQREAQSLLKYHFEKTLHQELLKITNTASFHQFLQQQLSHNNERGH